MNWYIVNIYLSSEIKIRETPNDRIEKHKGTLSKHAKLFWQSIYLDLIVKTVSSRLLLLKLGGKIQLDHLENGKALWPWNWKHQVSHKTVKASWLCLSFSVTLSIKLATAPCVSCNFLPLRDQGNHLDHFILIQQHVFLKE